MAAEIPSPTIQLRVEAMRDATLQNTIGQMSRATGRTVKEETRVTFKGMIRQALEINPPGSSGVSGRAAQRAGEAAIGRDLNRMGFVPVTIKGFRMVTVAFGHPITPVRVKTKENPRFADPAAIHDTRLQSKHGGKVTRGGSQAYYVSKSKMSALKTKLFQEVGRLASWLVPAADALGVPVPAWIARHGASGRGTQLQVVETENKITMRVVGHFPPGAEKEADTMRRRLAFLKEAAIGRLKRQLPFILRPKVRAAKT